jgi:hypothetical protein
MTTIDDNSSEKHFHYIIQAFDVTLSTDMQGNQNQQKHNGVDLVFIAKNNDEAFKKAEQILKKPAYQIVRIEECADPEVSHSFTSDLQREVMLNQIESMKRDKKNTSNIQ